MKAIGNIKSMKGFPRAMLLCIIVMILLSCKEEGEMGETGTLISSSNLTDDDWKNLNKSKIFFGHKSVGNNIIDGMNAVLSNNSKISLKIVKTRSSGEYVDGTFGHDEIGQNRKPHVKMDDFFQVMNGGLGNTVDIAFFKFCYVDIDGSSDIHKIFQAYKKKIAETEALFPQTTFLHCTVPLMRRENIFSSDWLKNRVKGFLGKRRGPTDISHNIARNRFNAMMRNEYGETERLFDLARFEATYPDGSREIVTSGKEMYECLVPEYTDDGGHLNEKGSMFVAEQLLIFLAMVSKDVSD